jgi:hypothetical protein
MGDGKILKFIARPIFGENEDFGGRYPSVFTENCETDCAAIDAAKRARDDMVSSISMGGGVSPYELICRKLKGREEWGKQLPEIDGPAESFCFFKDSRNPKRDSYINTAELWRAALKNSRHLQ